MTAYKFGHVILVGFPHTDLRNLSKRPAMILYDSGDKDVLVARITTQQYTTESDCKIENWKESGLIAESYIRLEKLATIEKVNILKLLGTLSYLETEQIKTVLKNIFNL
ncbi:MAG: type II toxin-antitoxin system PemK/MazF family toxin [Desulfamplus sp.]|nr:type II toxin-antitoxin system PemK/MazF family toxin [Desulfamplus sp.]